MAEGKPTLQHLNNSQSQTILWLLEELGIPYDVNAFERVGGRAPAALRATHPLGKSPQLITASGRVIVERSAIAAYLIDTYDADGRFKNHHHQISDAVREEELLGFAMASLNPMALLAVILHMTRALAPFFVRPLFAAAAAAVHRGFLDAELAAQLGWLDGVLAEVRPSSGGGGGDDDRDYFFLGGPDPTRVDFLVLFYVQVIAQPGLVDLAPYPHVRAWHDRCVARPAWKRGLERGNGYNLLAVK
ncbi:glutathione S-transferase [Xylariaceae sp. FL0804]|nr:glutathione S-transferase [Xylariaceae sp. FL0804]